MGVIKKPKTYSEVIGNFAYNLRYVDLPETVIEKIKLHFLDSIGSALACSHFEYARIIKEVLHMVGGKAKSTIIGDRKKSSAPMAALANGALIHGIDFDDTHFASVIHPSSFVVPTALAMAETFGSHGREVLTAAAAGYEVVSRLGMAASEKFHHRGFHATSILGAFGAAITAGKLLNLTPQQYAAATGIAGSIHGAGLQEFLNDGTWSKRLHPGWAAHAGIIAALLAKKDFAAPHRIFEGKYGLYNSYLGDNQYKKELLTFELGRTWETLKFSYKLYPCCHGVQIYMDSVFTLKKTYNISADNVKEIHAKVSEMEEKLIIGRDASKYRPETPYAARFSLPYCLAVVLTSDEIGPEKFSEDAIKNKRLIALARKVTYSVDHQLRVPELRGHVAIKTNNNDVYENTERALRGSPENPAEKSVIVNKFKANAQQKCSKRKQNDIISTLDELDRLENVNPLMRILRF